MNKQAYNLAVMRLRQKETEFLYIYTDCKEDDTTINCFKGWNNRHDAANNINAPTHVLAKLETFENPVIRGTAMHPNLPIEKILEYDALPTGLNNNVVIKSALMLNLNLPVGLADKYVKYRTKYDAHNWPYYGNVLRVTAMRYAPLSKKTFSELIVSPHEITVVSVAQNPHIPKKMLHELYARIHDYKNPYRIVYGIIKNWKCPQRLLRKTYVDWHDFNCYAFRRTISQNPNLPLMLLNTLTGDSHREVRESAKRTMRLIEDVK